MTNTFKVTDLFKKAWTNLKNHLWFLVSSSFIYFVVYIILHRSGKNSGSFLLSIASGIVSILFSLGMYRIGFKIYDGKTPDYSDFKTESRTFFAALWSSILTGFFTFIGFVLLIIPGIIVMIRLSMTTVLVLDKKMSGWQAVKASWNMTRGYSWKIFGYLFICIGILLVSIIPFGLGLVISVPLIFLTTVLLYKNIQSVKTEVMPAPEVAVISPAE
jgi:uncharacterized membrane protein